MKHTYRIGSVFGAYAPWGVPYTFTLTDFNSSTGCVGGWIIGDPYKDGRARYVDMPGRDLPNRFRFVFCPDSAPQWSIEVES